MTDITSIIRDLEQQRNAIDKALSALRELNGNASTSNNPVDITASDAPRKRQLSAAGRKRIIEATKRRWAEKRAGDSSAAAAKNSTVKSGSKKTTGKKPAAKQTAAKSSLPSKEPVVTKTERAGKKAGAQASETTT